MTDEELDAIAACNQSHKGILNLVTEVRRLKLGLSMLIEVHANVDFDTPEDNRIRDRAVEVARACLNGTDE